MAKVIQQSSASSLIKQPESAN